MNDQKVKVETANLQLHYPSLPSLPRTRSRRHQFTATEVTPLLANLSPASTWEALVATSAVEAAKDDSRSFVETSVVNASESERAWGIRAALAGKKIYEWYHELSSWPWRTGEAVPENPFESMVNDNRVYRYMDRVETIKDDMETLGVDELKNHVRETHVVPGSGLPNYKKLEDFAAIITATIVQSLPTLSYLTALLKIWSVRLIILKEIPSLLMELGSCRESMISAWLAIGQGVTHCNGPRPDFTKKSFISVKAVLQDQISELARKLDSKLDLLEGSRDTLPNKWIDRMDDLETEYSSWVVAAQDLVFTNEMGSSQSHHIPRTMDNQPLPPELTGRQREPNELEVTPLARSMNGTGVDGRLPLVLKPPSSDVKDLAGTWTVDGAGEDDTSNLEARIDEHDSAKKERPVRLSIPSSSLLHRKISNPDLASFSHSPGSDSTASEDVSNKSSPEIMSASIATFFGSPVEVMTPRVSARNSISSNTSRSVHRKSEPTNLKLPKSPERSILRAALRPQQRSATSPPDSPPPRQPHTLAAADQAPILTLGHTRVRSASMQSFEKIGNQDIRKLLVRRTGSYSPSTPSMPPPINHVAATLPSVLPDGSRSNDTKVKTTNPMTSGTVNRSLESTSNATTTESPKHQRTPSSTAKRFHKELSSPRKPLQHNPAKSVASSTNTRNRFEEFSDAPASTMSVKVQKLRSTNTSAQNPVISAGLNAPKDQFEARISRILTNIPADIRLKSTESKTPPPSSRPRNVSDPRTPQRRSITPKFLHAKTPTQSPSLTLEPAPKSASKPAQHGANDPETRIYHLQQSGKDTAPLKLHVRLVGEAGERVMVRVGGGWADLGEYLRDYAMHHGSSSKRSVSDNPYFDIQSLPSSSPAVSTPGGLSTPASKSRPVSPMTSSRPSSRSSWTEATGNESPSLMGLKAERLRKADISPGKQAWVEGMVDKARQGGSNANLNGNLKKEKRKSSLGGNREEGMGWLGKVGGTNRVFLRGKRDVSGP